MRQNRPTTNLDAHAGPAGDDPRERANRAARAGIKAVLLAGLGIALYLHVHNARFGGLNDWRAIDAAQVASNLARGRGLTTSVTYPLALRLQRPDTHGADIRQNPLYPMVLSAFIKLRGASDETVAMANGALFLLCALALYLLVSALYDGVTALFATLAYLLSMEALGQALTCAGTCLGALLLLIALMCVLRLTGGAGDPRAEEADQAQPRASGSLAWAVAAGAIFGLAYLAGGLSILVVLGLALLSARAVQGRPRLAVLAVILAAFAATCAPWAARNYRALHSLGLPLKEYELVMHTHSFPGQSILWSAPEPIPNPLMFVVTHPKQVAGKVARGLTSAYRAIPGVVSVYLWPFLALGFFLTAQTAAQGLAWRFLGLGVVLAAANLCLADVTDQSGLLVFQPIATAVAVGATVQFIRTRLPGPGMRTGVAAVLCAVLIFPYAASTLLAPRIPSSFDVHQLGLLGRAIDPGDLVATDLAWDYSWYTGRNSLLLPGTQDEFKRILAAGLRPGYVYLSSNVSASPQYGMGRPEWVAIARRQVNPARIGMGIPLPMPNGELLIELPFAQRKLSEQLRRAAEAAKKQKGTEGKAGP